ncbi:MAG: transcriptional regulator [Chloroflexi bacterium]|nr:MAG: transcriptional regulator [Chloroflexota bacterium]
MPRTYDIEAPIARALDLLGERWTLLIIRQLLSGDQRFGELYGALYGISSNLLSMRLRTLMEADIIERVRLNGGGRYYRLTPRGEALAPIVWSLNAWAQTYLDKTTPNLPRHDRCQQPLTLEWYCENCRRYVEDTELDFPPSL